MKKIMQARLLLLLAFSLFFVQKKAVFAQKTIEKTDSAAVLKGLGKWDGSAISLRWAPASAGAWMAFSATGYVIERSWFDSTMRSSGAPVRLVQQPIRPMSLAAFEQFLKPMPDGPDKNFVAAAAQCLYGKTSAGAAPTLLDQAADLQNRWSYSLFCADVSQAAATASGLAFLDKNGLEKGRIYVYRIFPAAVPAAGIRADTLEIFVKTDAPQKTPKVVLEAGAEGEKSVTLSWSKPLHDAHFSGYFIERSTDGGKTYRSLNEQPYVFMTDERIAQPLDFIRFIDSVGQNYQPAFYRVVGLTPFGERSEPSDPQKLMGRDRTPPHQPSSVRADHQGGQKVKISWKYDGPTGELRGFLIGRSSTASGKFDDLTPTALPPTRREFMDETMPRGTNFYIVAAVDTAGNAMGSLTAFAAVIDSVPPQKPVGLAGKIDTNGTVRLHWPLGKDPDIAGYRIWQANQADHVFINLTEKLVLDTAWTDSISLQTLTESIFYRLQAVDVNDNSSAISEILELKKPDRVAPVSALMTDFRVQKDGIQVSWQPSTSHDVVAHEVLKKRKGAAAWQVAATVKKEQNAAVFMDFKAKTGETYLYNVRAIDDAGLKSELQNSIEATMIDQKPPAGVENLTAKFDAEKRAVALAWSLKNAPNAAEIILFRSENGGPLRSIERVKATEKGFFDRTAKAGKNYEYSARAVFADGRQSPFSEYAAAAVPAK